MDKNTHDATNIVSSLRQVLSADKLPLGFLLGAGCPCAVRVPDANGGSSPLIHDIAGVTSQVFNELSKTPSGSALSKLVETFKEDEQEKPSVEDMLNRVRSFKEVAGNSSVRGLTLLDLVDLDRAICDQIRTAVSKPLPASDNAYHALAHFLRLSRQAPTELFTTNYDLLMEEALERSNVPFFDGFVGSVRPFFDLRAVEEDEVAQRWTRLWKIHGSVNWRISENTKQVFRAETVGSDDAELMIHPSRLKYDESRRMPYLVMLDRLRQYIRTPRPVALFISGYSFRDDHINEAIVEGLRANSSAVCFAFQYGQLDNYPSAINLAKNNPNLALLAQDGAVFRSIREPWGRDPGVDVGMLQGIFRVESSEIDSSEKCLFELGDFDALGGFLRQFVSFSASRG